MANARLAEWLETRYSCLSQSFAEQTFTMADATKSLSAKFRDDKRTVAVALSGLRKGGRLNVTFDATDARKRHYRLRSVGELLSETLSMPQPELTRSDLESLLKKAADLIRTRVDYKFILVLLFLKRVSDKWALDYEKAYKDAVKDGLDEKEAVQEAKQASYHDFDIPEEYLWDNLRKDVAGLPEKFSQALSVLAERNPELKDVLASADFVDFTRSRENAEILRQLVELMSEKKLHHVSPDVLGDAYEWILMYFAPQKAKEGEIYTPREVIRLLVEILHPKPGEGVYDPACGSGRMLIAAHKYVEEGCGQKGAKKLFLYGQEVNQKTIALARMNMHVHDIRDANLAFGDTLMYPKFKEGDGPKQFDVVIANPPWNQDGYDEEVLKKGEFWKQRFGHGFGPRQSADWAWVQHMVASAKAKTGRVGVVIDNGCLFRGGKERAVRIKALEADQLDAVVLLPEKLFYNTGAPGALLFLDRRKSPDRKNKVLFINASSQCEKHPEVRKLNRLGDEHIKRIVEAHGKFEDVEGFARVVSLDEIKGNDYNLNVTLYVFPEEKTEEIDIAKEWAELRELEKEIVRTEEKIEGYLEEVGL